MIIQFTVKNFRSIKKEVVFSMVAEPLRDDVTTLSIRNSIRLLPVAGIFGANASGKSNLVKAFSFMHGAITMPSVNFDAATQVGLVPAFLLDPTSHPMLMPFLLNAQTRNKPIMMEVILWDEEEKVEYQYGFEINKKRVLSEWLKITSRIEKKYSSRNVFVRQNDEFEVGKTYKKDLDLLVNKVQPTKLAVSVFSQLSNNKPSTRLVALMNKAAIVDGTYDINPMMLDKLNSDPKLLEKVQKFLNSADSSIKKVMVSKVEARFNPNAFQGTQTASGIGARPAVVMGGYKIQTEHHVQNSKDESVMFDLVQHESFGNQRLLGIATLLFQVLDNAGTLIFDEFGAGLHPFISMAIVEIFQNKESNPKNAQLIFCSHDTYLLSDEVGLRRDEVWFTNKSKSEETTLHSLSEYKTRSDLKIAKNYLEGRFAALPVTNFKFK